MRVDVLTREYPPEVYGGAGVHAAYLVRELRRLAEVRVRCFGEPRSEPGVTGYPAPAGLATANPALRVIATDVAMAADCAGADLVHSHTWYANLAGHLAKLLYGIPHVATTHSLEPRRPWKAEQLGGGYALSSWAERTALEAADAIIAVSAAMREDVLAAYPAIDPERVAVVHNGIDTAEFAPGADAAPLGPLGVDPHRPSVVFVGRITRQKGLPLLLRAAADFPPEAQLVVCAGAPDTAELAAEVAALVDRLRSGRRGVQWIERPLDRGELLALLGHASVFVCPSVYEPMGIVNLEAMACGAPVVASRTGGIPEVVLDGVTGLLVPLGPTDPVTGQPLQPDRFAGAFAAAVTTVLADPAGARRMGAAGRQRAVAEFSWPAVAARVHALYRQLLAAG